MQRGSWAPPQALSSRVRERWKGLPAFDRDHPRGITHARGVVLLGACMGREPLTAQEHHPVDLLKVDASFTAGLSRDRAATAVIQGVITMAKAMDVPCMIEGIETQRQLDALLGQGILGRGRLWGKPEGKDATPSIPRPRQATAPPRPVPSGPTRSA